MTELKQSYFDISQHWRQYFTAWCIRVDQSTLGRRQKECNGQETLPGICWTPPPYLHPPAWVTTVLLGLQHRARGLQLQGPLGPIQQLPSQSKTEKALLKCVITCILTKYHVNIRNITNFQNTKAFKFKKLKKKKDILAFLLSWQNVD